MSGAGKTIRWPAAAAVVGVAVVATGAWQGVAREICSDVTGPPAALTRADCAPQSVADWPAGLPSLGSAATHAHR